MFYQIHISDDRGQFGWFHIISGKESAMGFAKEIALENNLEVVYISEKSEENVYNGKYDATRQVVVQQRKYLYFGA